jgi:hypothetical protein
MDRRQFGLAPGGELLFLALIAGLAFGLGLDEPALLHHGERRSRAENEAKQGGEQEFQGRPSFKQPG